jgi:polyhydroxyalkanoate synthesis regulator phasin
MTAKRKKTLAKRKTTTRGRKAVRRAARKGAAEPWRATWDRVVEALHTTQTEVEKQFKTLLKRYNVGSKDAASAVADLRKRLDRQRKQALKDIEKRGSKLQHRVQKERKAFSHMVDEAARNALAAFNIPSRQEVSDLTRKVDQLSRKIDALKR